MDGGVSSPKTLTLAEANARLPQVRVIMARLQELGRALAESAEGLEVLDGAAAEGSLSSEALSDQSDILHVRQLEQEEAFRSSLASLEALGGVLKSVGEGLVDFHAMRGDEMVFLCWKVGEERIRFWHTLEGGFAGRQPLSRW